MKNGKRKLDKQKLKKNMKLVLLVLAIYILAVAIIVLLVDGRRVRFYLVDGQEIETAYGRPFEDPGRRAVSTGRITGDGEIDLPVVTLGEVDTQKLGTYELTYTVEYRLRSYSTTRIVHVVDMTPPVITLSYREDYRPSWFTGYLEEGYSAWDDCDGDMTFAVERRVLEDGVEYRATDAAGNETVVVRPIEFSRGIPRIRLNGGEKQELSAQMYYEDPGFTATDDYGDDLSEYVQVEGEVIPYVPGTYELRYFMTNEQGESISALRTVEVSAVELPETVMPEGKVIYLTFDDGPGSYTGRLLDILAKYDVKATFFVTAERAKYEDMVGRAFREGHSIGVHSASHNYYQIYASEQAFFEDFNRAEEMIERQTGQRTRLFRFPGGSSNTVSSFNPGIMSRLTTVMRDMGYQYFDWNVTSGDAGETTRTTVVRENIIDGCSEQDVSVVLQHDIKDFSVAAVEYVIKWGKSHGYTFLPMDMSSPPMHHRLNN